VENVVFLAPFSDRSATTRRTRRQQFLSGMPVPGVCALFLKPLDHVAQRAEIFQPSVAAIAVENDDRHAPKALPRDAPIRAPRNLTITGLAVKTSLPLYSGRPSVYTPRSSNGAYVSKPYFCPVLKSSTPCPGAVCTMPLP